MSNLENTWLMPVESFYDLECPSFSTLKGKTLTGIYFHPEYQDRILITVDEDISYFLYHYQDCCESVYIESISGITGKYGEEILEAVESCRKDPHANACRKDPCANESGTFSFYYLKTNTQDICLRWYGTSNGYYSEKVSLYLIPKAVDADPKFLLKQDL